MLFHQFHDILPGSSIREVYVDATEKLRGMERTGEAVLGEALSTLASNVDTRAIRTGRPLIVFNGLAWERTDLVRHRLGTLDGSTYAVFDAAGTEIPSQITGGALEREILFIARKVPAMGLQVYELRRVERAASPPPSGRRPSSCTSTIRTIRPAQGPRGRSSRRWCASPRRTASSWCTTPLCQSWRQ